MQSDSEKHQPGPHISLQLLVERLLPEFLRRIHSAHGFEWYQSAQIQPPLPKTLQTDISASSTIVKLLWNPLQ